MFDRLSTKSIIKIIIFLPIIESIVYYYLHSAGLNYFSKSAFVYNFYSYLLRYILIALPLIYSILNRKHLPNIIKQYFPIVVLGVLYCFCIAFIIKFLQLDFGPLTYSSILVGLINNLSPVLLIAICYQQFPNFWWRVLYFCSYFFTALVLLFDTVYFCNTSTHVEKILFDNLNIYSISGVLSSLAVWQLTAVVFFVILFVLLFRLPPTNKIPPPLHI